MRLVFVSSIIRFLLNAVYEIQFYSPGLVCVHCLNPHSPLQESVSLSVEDSDHVVQCLGSLWPYLYAASTELIICFKITI
jgi:hypothetical protein